MKETMTAADLPEPVFKTDWIFTVVFRRTVEETVEKTVEKILKAMKERPKITAKELQTLTGLSRRGVEYQLDKLKNEKIIERIGPTKGGEWKVLTAK